MDQAQADDGFLTSPGLEIAGSVERDSAAFKRPAEAASDEQTTSGAEKCTKVKDGRQTEDRKSNLHTSHTLLAEMGLVPTALEPGKRNVQIPPIGGGPSTSRPALPPGLRSLHLTAWLINPYCH
ncbi:UNVERIFIED_CONTAM: hypothetical protein K2H54_035673 [Gekko kuhli]